MRKKNLKRGEVQRLKKIFTRGFIYDLGQPYHVGMPHHSLHPAFLFSLTRKHGDYTYGDGVSAAAEMFTTGGHVGTHLDSLGHVSKNGKLFSGLDVSRVQDYNAGLTRLGIDETFPILGRGVLLDVAKFKGLKVLEYDYAVSAEDLERTAAAERVSIRRRDTVLIRTGWANYWGNSRRFVSNKGTPGPDLGAAKWLSSKGIFLTGSDTLSFEKMPSDLPVHEFLLTKKGIQILEMLNLEGLSRDNVFEFVFVVSPLKIRGGTASPVRPIAIV